MTTLVFRNNIGSLIQTQIGAADLVATFQAARAGYGWLGGLDSVRFLFNAISNTFRPQATKLKNLDIDSRLQLLHSTAYILTSEGVKELLLEDGAEAFGKDERTRIIGLTICALAHELDGPVAVRLFTNVMAPALFQAPLELVDALQIQLSESTIWQRILNEGSVRGLTSLFNKTAAHLGFGGKSGEWMRTNFPRRADDDYELSEVHMVGGLLRWIGEQSTAAYFTRSALVARVAVYLKTVGYLLGAIITWDGQGQPPGDSGPNAVVLVIGGCFPTDQFILDAEDVESHGTRSFLHHYRYNTVGNLLINALQHEVNMAPEVLQDDFEYVQHYISAHTIVRWKGRPSLLPRNRSADELVVSCEWNAVEDATSVEKALSGICFPNCGESLAPCYRRIGNVSMLTNVRDTSKRRVDATYDAMDPDVARFRTLTAAIVVALTSRLAPDTFQRTGHLTYLQLVSDVWLDAACHNIDRLASGHVHIGAAALALASVHTGVHPSKTDEDHGRGTIGYRNGIYCVLPTLVFTMKPAVTSLGFTCTDQFIANLAVAKSGGINSTNTRRIFSEAVNMYPGPGNKTALATLTEPWDGKPSPAPPDRPLYLSVERDSFGNDDSIGFAGRIDGAVVGHVSVSMCCTPS